MDIEALQEELEFAISEGDEGRIAEIREALDNAWREECGEFDYMDDCFYDGPEYY